MAKKGEAKKVKALNAPKTAKIHRKENIWTARNKAGSHNKEDSVALLIVLRDLIKIGENAKEIRKILNQGLVKVNEKIVKDPSMTIGLFDLINIESQELIYRVSFDKKRRIILKELEKITKEKIVKVTNKKINKKDILLGTNDGRVIKESKAKVGDSLKISLPDSKIQKIIELKEGNLVYVTKGAHCSSIAKIKNITLGSIKKEKLVKIEIDGKEYETVQRNIIAIGQEKVEIDGIN